MILLRNDKSGENENSGLLIRVAEDNELIFSLLMLFIHGASTM